MNQKFIVLGAGGHAKVLIDTLQASGTTVHAILDNDSARHGTKLLDVPVLGSDDLLSQFAPSDVALVNGVGSVDLPERRIALYLKLKQAGYRFASVLHPSAVVSRHARLGEGVQVLAGAVIQADASIGANSLINTGARVDHDCVIDEHVHIAPGAVLSGGVAVGTRSHIGVGATVIQRVCIGKCCLIAAGAVVVSDVADDCRMAGVPAKVLKK
jgi:UDP-perosamine 4-acetyltransferase